MPEFVLAETQDQAAVVPALSLEEQLSAERAGHALVKEAYADLQQLYMEDVGWRRIGSEDQQFTAPGRKQMAAVADLMITGNPLVKRGVRLRIAYVWGQGVTVTVRDDGSEGQDLNAVLQAFWDEPTNRKEFTSSEAQARYERRLASSGEAFWALPTDQLTGRVRIRRIPSHEITDRICDPEDAGTVWFYQRDWTAVTVDRTTGARGSQQRTTLYPALGFYPPVRPDTWRGKEVRWDAPIRPVIVNEPEGDWRGVGDALAALPWARMDKEFLEDFAVYMRALTRILGQVTSKDPAMAGRVRNALNSAAAASPDGTPKAGQWAAMDPNTTMSLVSKSGATIDSDSHRPFATMVASALEVPLTMLLSDPGISGARATAETLDQPTELMANLRRGVHAELFRDVTDYVIDQAVIAPAGPLRGGLLSRDGDRLVVTLPEGDDRTVEVKWPDYDSTPLKDRVAAIVDADSTDVLPELEVFKLLARALGIEDLDDLVESLTDADGNWLNPRVSAGQRAAEKFRDGADPAADFA